MELRKDYVLDRWTIIAQGRGKRPQQLKEEKRGSAGKDFFAPGNEHLTPPETGRIGGKKWRFRWFANKFPAVDTQGNPGVKTHNDYFTFADAYGTHEIIVETPSKKTQLWDLTKEDLVTLFRIYRERIQELSSKDNINYVTVFKNHGDKGGASLPHSHTQVIATSMIPPNVTAQKEAVGRYKKNPYDDIIEKERDSERQCYENSTAIAFAPYASRFNYELWIFPKRHITNMAEFNDNELDDFVELLHKALGQLRKLNVSYNYFLYYDPSGTDIRFRLELTPRIANWAGFELSSGITINTVSPEQAAAFYRGEAEF